MNGRKSRASGFFFCKKTKYRGEYHAKQGTFVSLKDQFVDCIADVRKNLALYRTLIGEFMEHSGKAEALLLGSPLDVPATKTKILTVASIVAVMHKSSAGEVNRQARMLATEALVSLNAFGEQHFGMPFLSADRMRPILANDFMDQAGRSKKKAKRGEGGSTSAQT